MRSGRKSINLIIYLYNYLFTYEILLKRCVIRGNILLISLFNTVRDTFLPGISVSEYGNLYSQIDSHIIQLALLAIVKIQHDAHLTHIRTILSFLRDDQFHLPTEAHGAQNCKS